MYRSTDEQDGCHSRLSGRPAIAQCRRDPGLSTSPGRSSCCAGVRVWPGNRMNRRKTGHSLVSHVSYGVRASNARQWGGEHRLPAVGGFWYLSRSSASCAGAVVSLRRSSPALATGSSVYPMVHFQASRLVIARPGSSCILPLPVHLFPRSAKPAQ